MIFSAAHNVVVYTVPEPAQIVAAVAGTRQLDATRVAVPATLPALQLARVLGLPVPPLLDLLGYDWPMQPGRTPYDHQRHMANFHLLHPRGFNLSEMGCVDAETEYLSPTGWRRMDQYNGGMVAQYHLDGRAEFVVPSEYVKLPCTEMYRFKTTKGVDQKLSAEHRVLWVDYEGCRRVSSAARVAEQQEIRPRGWKGRFITTFSGLGGLGIALTEAQLRLQVAVIADGHFASNTKWCVVRLKKERKKTRLRQHLNAAKIGYVETMPEYDDALDFSVFRFRAPRRDKVFDSYYWQCSLEQMRIVADEVVHWDGSARKDHADGFYSTQKQSADFVQFCYAATGRTAALGADEREDGRTLYRVHARKKSALLYLTGWSDSGHKTSPITVEPTIDGLKYCFMVPTTFLIFRRNGRIFVSGNTGKTQSVLWAADYLMREGLIRSALVLAPLSTLKRVWDDEIFRSFIGKRKATILHSSVRQERLDRLRRPADFYLLNHDGLGLGSRKTHMRLELGPLAAHVRDHPDIGLIVVDEASAYKDHATLRSRILRATIGSKPYIWLLSGTPTPNAPTDAYALARIIGNLEGESFKSFRGRTMAQVSPFKYVPRASSAAIVRKALSPAIRYSRAECIDLPECVVETRDVELSPAQERAYKEMKKDLQVTLSSGRIITAVNEAVLRLKLIQIECGSVYGPDHEVHKVDCAPRLKVLKEVIDEAGGKVLVFAPLTAVVQLLYTELRATYGEHAVARVYGGTSQKARSEIFRAFEQEDNPRIIAADPGTMAHGLTLVAADTIVWFGPHDRGEVYQQANARMNRPGQTRKMLIVRLASTPVVREIYRRLHEHESLQNVVLRMVEEDR